MNDAAKSAKSADPENASSAQTVRAPDPASGGAAHPPKEEPELRQEESVPSDGKDAEGTHDGKAGPGTAPARGGSMNSPLVTDPVAPPVPSPVIPEPPAPPGVQPPEPAPPVPPEPAPEPLPPPFPA